MNLLLLAQQARDDWAAMLIVFGVVALILAFVMFVLFAKYFNLWIQAKTTHANIRSTRRPSSAPRSWPSSRAWPSGTG